MFFSTKTASATSSSGRFEPDKKIGKTEFEKKLGALPYEQRAKIKGRLADHFLPGRQLSQKQILDHVGQSFGYQTKERLKKIFTPVGNSGLSAEMIRRNVLYARSQQAREDDEIKRNLILSRAVKGEKGAAGNIGVNVNLRAGTTFAGGQKQGGSAGIGANPVAARSVGSGAAQSKRQISILGK